MVVETSAVLAILLDEPEAAEFAQLIEDDPAPLISAASVLEAGSSSSVAMGSKPGATCGISSSRAVCRWSP